MSDARVLGPGSVLGVVGGGQLGRMFVQAAQRMGYSTVVLTPRGNSPAAMISEHVIEGDLDHLESLRELAARADAITVEFENVSAPGLRWLERTKPVRPGWKSIHTAQNRIREKRFLARNGFPLPEWAPLVARSDLDRLGPLSGQPVILKTAASGYDGKGQIRLDSGADAAAAWQTLGNVPCVVESVVDFVGEISCIVARGVDGSTEPFPVFWNEHSHHILDLTIAPAPIGPIATSQALQLATEIAARLGTVGLLTVEMFLTRTGELLVNELAPRPHNSGHLTIEAAATSQFEQQVRALCGLPLGSGAPARPAAMANLLGDLWEAGTPRWVDCLRRDPAIGIHLYGKNSARRGRKMGHITVVDERIDVARARVLAARQTLRTGDPA